MLKIAQHEVYDINSLLDPQTGEPMVEGPVVGYGIHQGIDAASVAEALTQYQNLQIKAQRKAAYMAESDPIYMEYLYDESSEKLAQWKAAVADIKQRLPFV